MNVDIFAIDDLYELREIRELAISPDGSKALYVERQFGHGQDHSFDTLWLASTEGVSTPFLELGWPETGYL